MRVGSIFYTGGGWVSGGFGVDKGTDKNGAHNGIEVFSKEENQILESILDKGDWIEKLPQNGEELLRLFQNGDVSEAELIGIIDLGFKPTKD